MFAGRRSTDTTSFGQENVFAGLHGKRESTLSNRQGVSSGKWK
jgi:hypothetical protein